MKHTVPRHSAGFTLVEVITALALLVVIFTGFTAVVKMASQLNMTNLHLREAYQESLADLVQEKDLASEKTTCHFTMGNLTVDVPIVLQKTQGDVVLSSFRPQP